MPKIKVSPPISGGVILSYGCAAACRHCAWACSPERTADWITPADLERLFALLAPHIRPARRGPESIGISEGLHFSGGEPFLDFPLLLEATRMAAALRIPSLFVETSASWCDNDALAHDRFMALRKAGLNGLFVSANPFLAEYVPFSHTQRCVRLAIEAFGPNVIVYESAYYHRLLALNSLGRIPLERYLELAPDERFSADGSLFVMGRAVTHLRAHYPKYPARALFGLACRPPVLRDWHNHFDNYGHFIPGSCAGVSLGSWHELDRLLRDGISTSAEPVLGYILSEDIAGLYHFARDCGFVESDAGYISKCDLCLDLRQHLIARGDFPELQPADFYTELRRGRAAGG